MWREKIRRAWRRHLGAINFESNKSARCEVLVLDQRGDDGEDNEQLDS